MTRVISYLDQVVTDLDGNYITQVGGGGGEGLRDGSFENAAFNRPQVGFMCHSGHDDKKF